MPYYNGKLPDGSLKAIPGGRLRKDAAIAWNDMNKEAQEKYGVSLRPTGPMSSYRTYSQQVYFWNLYQSGQGNLAARPGTSNHGRGTAVDLSSPKMREVIDKIGHKYGWKKIEAPSEWWHVNFVGGYKRKVNPLATLTKEEQAWVREYIKLKKANKNRARRIKLRRVLRQHRKAVYKKAQKHGWSSDIKKRFSLLKRYS